MCLQLFRKYDRVACGEIMKNKVRGSLQLLFATVIWGSAFIAQRAGMDKLGPFTFQTIRCALALLFLFPTATIVGAKKVGRKQSLRMWLEPELLKSGLLCGIALFSASSLQQLGLVETDAGKAGFLTAMYIVLVPLLGVFLGRKPSRSALLSVLPAVVGLYLLSWSGSGSLRRGDFLLIACALAFSVQITLIDRYAGSMDGLRLNCIQSAVVVVLSLPFMLFGESVNAADIVQCWLPLGYAGVLSMGVAYTLQITGQRSLEPTAASLIMSLESVFAVLFGFLLLHERLTAREGLGCVLMFSAVVLSQLPEKQKACPPPAIRS